MAVPESKYCLLFWYYYEKHVTVQNCDSIVSPRVDPKLYTEGQLVLAKCKGKAYRAVIVRIKDQKDQLKEDQKKLVQLAKDPTKEANTIMECMGVKPEKDLEDIDSDEYSSGPDEMSAGAENSETSCAVKDSSKSVPAVKDSSKSVPAVKDSSKSVPAVKDSSKSVPAVKDSSKSVPALKDPKSAVKDSKSVESQSLHTEEDSSIAEEDPKVSSAVDQSVDYLPSITFTPRNKRKVEQNEDAQKYCKRKMKKLSEQLELLEKRILFLEQQRPGPAAVSAPLPGPSQSPSTSGLSEEAIRETVKHFNPEKDLDAIFQGVAHQIFTDNDLINKSRTGKKTSKCGADGPRPKICSERYTLMEKLAMQMSNGQLDQKSVKDKFANLQKMMRRDLKKKTDKEGSTAPSTN